MRLFLICKICKLWSRDNKKLTCVSYPSIPFFAQNFFITLGYMLITFSYFRAKNFIHRLSTGTLCARGSVSVWKLSVKTQCENSSVFRMSLKSYPQVIHRRRLYHTPPRMSNLFLRIFVKGAQRRLYHTPPQMSRKISIIFYIKTWLFWNPYWARVSGGNILWRGLPKQCAHFLFCAICATWKLLINQQLTTCDRICRIRSTWNID